MISLERISFGYPRQSLFDAYHWEVERGQPWAVLGPSGCGKTTLLYLLAGLLFPSAGQIRVGGLPLTRPRPETGLILQDFGLLPWNTVLDNVRLGLNIRSFYGPDGKHSPVTAGQVKKNVEHKIGQAQAWIERLGLGGLEHQYPGQLSGGQRQRVAIARTLVLQPDLLLMDEPFSSLDAPTRLGLRELTLALWREQQFTFIVVTHDIEEAAHLGRQILVLGRPPHTRAEIIDNPVFGQPNLDERDEYRELTRELRQRMMQFGAQLSAPGEGKRGDSSAPAVQAVAPKGKE